MEATAKIADKIAKIIAKAEGTNNPAEAAAFMEKAQALMIEHGLSLLDLGTLDRDDPVAIDYGATGAGSGDTWQNALAFSLAEYYGARVLKQKIRNRYYHHVVGRKSARVTFIAMFPYVCKQINALGREAHAAGRYPTAARARSAIGQAFVWRLTLLLREERASGAAQEGRGLNALVPVDQIDAAIRDAFQVTAGRRKNLRFNTADIEDANKISLHKQTEGGGNSVLRLA